MTQEAVRVLLVDDTKGDYLLTRMLLADVPGTQYQLDWAENYDDGLKALTSLPYEACLVDYKLQNRSGIEFIRTAIAAGIRTPNILFTAQGDPQVDRQALEAGAVDYLDKGQISSIILDRSVRYARGQENIQRKLHDSENLLRSTLNALSKRIAILNETGTIIEVNNAWSNAGGLDGKLSGSTRGTNCLELLEAGEKAGNPNANEIAGCLRAVLTGKSQHEYLEYKTILNSGVYWSALRINRFQVSGAVRIALSVEDITNRVSLELQLRQSQKMEAVGQLAGGIAHDFNNLLTVVLGYSSTILAKLDPTDELRVKLEAIEAAGKRAVGLTRQLLAFSRKQVMQPKVMEVNEVVESMRPLLRHVTRSDIALEMQLGSSMRRVKADPNQLEQVLMNLVINARDAMPTGGKLTVQTGMVYLGKNDRQLMVGMEPGLYARIRVSDTGSGMDTATQSRIFEPFFTTKPVGQGTGLGLSTVYGIVKQSEGYISVSSEPGAGSSFQIYLPPCAEDRETAIAEPDPGALTGTETILLTEDEDEIREYTASALRSYGYRVFAAANAEKAISVCAELKGQIALLITDIVMPKVNGPELAQILAPLSSGMGVLYISGYSRDAIAMQGILNEGLNLLEKPFTPEQLAKRVKQILEKRRRGKSILVIDDEPEILELVSQLLSDAGYRVSTASNGQDAIAICREQSFDLVITDLVMPTREGLDTIQHLRTGSSAMPIIAMSGAFEGRYLRVAKNLGADRVLEKPIEPSALLESVQGLLG